MTPSCSQCEDPWIGTENEDLHSRIAGAPRSLAPAGAYFSMLASPALTA